MARPLIYRHSIVTRVTHWTFFVTLLVLVSSGLQIYNAAPYLDASDKSDPAKRVLSIGSGTTANPDAPVGTVTIFGRTFSTTGFLGYTDDGMGGRSARAFPAWLTIPSYQDLADGRRWHLFFAWVMIACGALYIAGGLLRRDFRELVVRPNDFPKMIPMQLYYLRIRKEPPPYGLYNPLQKLGYTLVIFVFAPLLVLSGLALSPGMDAIAHPLTVVFGGRQFARLWHFVFMLGLVGFFIGHVLLVATTGLFNNMRSMITGRYRPEHKGQIV